MAEEPIKKVKPEESLIAEFGPQGSDSDEEIKIVPMTEEAAGEGARRGAVSEDDSTEDQIPIIDAATEISQEVKEPLKLKTEASKSIRERYIKLKKLGFDMSMMDEWWKKNYRDLQAINKTKKESRTNVTNEEIAELAHLELALSVAMDKFEKGYEEKKQIERETSIDDVRRGIAHLFSQLLHEATGGGLDIKEQQLDSKLNAYLSRLPFNNPIEAGRFTGVVKELSELETRVQAKERRIVDEARAVLNNAKIFTLEDVRERLPEMEEVLGWDISPSQYAKRKVADIAKGVAAKEIDDVVREHLAYQGARRDTIQSLVSIKEIQKALQGGILNYFENYVNEHIAPLMPRERAKKAGRLNAVLMSLTARKIVKREEVRKLEDKLQEFMRQSTRKIFNRGESVAAPRNIRQPEIRRKLGDTISAAVEKPKSGTLGNLIESVKTLLVRGEWYWHK